VHGVVRIVGLVTNIVIGRAKMWTVAWMAVIVGWIKFIHLYTE